jgi:hypothetical protein
MRSGYDSNSKSLHKFFVLVPTDPMLSDRDRTFIYINIYIIL